MMGGFLVALDELLYRRVADTLVGFGAGEYVGSDGCLVVQLADAKGRLFTLYDGVPRGLEWEYRDGPHIPAPGVAVPDMSRVVGCPFECRWVDLAVEVVALVAHASDHPTWLLDDNDVVWDARALDPERVRL